MWLFLAILCIGLGLVLFSGLQPSLPDELSFLKSKDGGAEVVQGTVSTAPLPPVTTASNWNLVANGDGLEISRDFSTQIHGANGTVYDQPIFYLTCYKEALYARIDTRLHTKGEKTAHVVWQGTAQTWVHGEGQNIFAPDIGALIHSMREQGTVQVSLEFNEAPRQNLLLRLDGLQGALGQLQKKCRLPV